MGNSSGNEVYAEPYTGKGTLLDQLGPKNIRAQGSMEEEREEIILEVTDGGAHNKEEKAEEHLISKISNNISD